MNVCCFSFGYSSYDFIYLDSSVMHALEPAGADRCSLRCDRFRNWCRLSTLRACAGLDMVGADAEHRCSLIHM